MTAAAAPARRAPVSSPRAEPPGPAVLPLPSALAAAVDALDERPVHPVRVRHPRTGEVFRLVPETMATPTVSPVETPTIHATPEGTGPSCDRPFTPAEKAEYDGGESDIEAILEGVADADAGRFVTDAEIDVAMKAKFPFLRDLPAPDGGDPGGEPAAVASNGMAAADAS